MNCGHQMTAAPLDAEAAMLDRDSSNEAGSAASVNLGGGLACFIIRFESRDSRISPATRAVGLAMEHGACLHRHDASIK